ncbi:armadillo-type protein [Elsinoe ampelina]|uniref:Armadillo-type protein n=1 Tax=Elsinoe ampelina TaxID=302913 RepID=A0A6A6FZZ1_9PEZI|nr:armadillo-type protein [Elsinoe ampelina]
MAPRSRRKASSPVEAVEPEDSETEGEAGEHSLNFDQQLIGRPGKPIAVAELLKRLKTLSAELVAIDQERCPEDDVKAVGRDLVHANVLGHKDKGVRAWAACCIVEVFRLTAPHAPYTGAQLKEIFEYIITTVIPALGSPQDPYSNQHMRIVASLDEVKSIVLVGDIPSSESLMVRLFATVFDLVTDFSKEDGEKSMGKNVEISLTSLLSSLVEESETLPAEVVELILAQFLRTDSGLTSLSRKGARSSEQPARELPPAYVVAKNICSNCPSRMSRAVSQYFSTIVVDASDSAMSAKTKPAGKKRRRGDESDDEDNSALAGPSTQDMKELAKAHKLLRELWRSSPDCIQNVVPQLEAELAAENVDIRVLAVETTGDLVSGVGAAGLPESEPLDPAAYPSQSVESGKEQAKSYDVLTAPAAPQDFGSTYPGAYSNFISRKNDKSAHVRSAFASAVGRILLTSAGSIGLDRDEMNRMLKCLSDLLQDSDDKVRLAAVRAIAGFSFGDVVQKLGPSGGADEEDSVLHQLVNKIRDRKQPVRAEAMELASKLWGVASGAIIEGNERIQALFGAIPSKILETAYANDADLNMLAQSALFENLIPLQYPPIKDKTAAKANGNSQRIKDSQASQSSSATRTDPDAIRAERILALCADLDTRAKRVFFVMQKQQVKYGQYMEAFLKLCEDWNGGVTTNSEGTDVKSRLGKVIDGLSRRSPEPMTASDHLWKFAKKHDRRAYHLIRFTFDVSSDYKKVVNAIKEIKKRFSEATGNTSSILITLLPMILQSSILVYNRSHVPTILKFSRREESDFSNVAHEVLREISENHPDVFKAHVRTMCTSLIEHVPNSDAELDDGTVQTLKACAGFAQKYPQDMPQERALLESMVQYALHSNPPEAAKHAVSVIASSQGKKDMYVKEIVSKCTKDFSLESDNYMSRLAALSQVMLLAAPDLAEDETDAITTIAIRDVLMVHSEPTDDDKSEWKDELDEDTAAKIWAARILVNRQRGYAALTSGADADKTVQDTARPVYSLLQKLLSSNGQLSDQPVPAYRKSRLRVTAGILLLKLSCASKQLDHMLEPNAFNTLALLGQDPLTQVRLGFVTALKKYLGQNRLPNRFHAMTFLLAFEPSASVKDPTLTWLRARAANAAKLKDSSMEYALARLLSLLTHHTDFSLLPEHQTEFAQYILFYLRAVARPDNLPLIYAVAQRCKTVQDGIDPDNFNERLWCLTDIALATIREFADVQGWQLRAYTGDKIGMPAGIFATIKGHAKSQEVAEKTWADEAVLEGLEDEVRGWLKGRKRKGESANGARKKPRTTTNGVKKDRVKKTPKRKSWREDGDGEGAEGTGERRKSSRGVIGKSYKGMDDSETEGGEEDEDEDMEDAIPSRPNKPASIPTPTSRSKARSTKAVAEVEDDDDTPPPAEPSDQLTDEEEDATPVPSTVSASKGKRKAPASKPAASSPAAAKEKKKPQAKAKQKQPLRGAGKKVTRGAATRATRSRKSAAEVEDEDEEGDQDEEMEDVEGE